MTAAGGGGHEGMGGGAGVPDVKVSGATKWAAKLIF